MKGIYKLEAVDFTEWTEDGETIIYENHLKRRKLFGITLSVKRYRAITSRNKRRKDLGFK